MAPGELTTCYKNISIPLLVVAGSEDDDPYAITTPCMRMAILSKLSNSLDLQLLETSKSFKLQTP